LQVQGVRQLLLTVSSSPWLTSPSSTF